MECEWVRDTELKLLIDGLCLISPNFTNCRSTYFAEEFNILGSCD